MINHSTTFFVLFCQINSLLYDLFRLHSVVVFSAVEMTAEESGERFEIERIVDKRYRNDRMEYLIKWRGYPDTQNTWEPCK